MKNVLKLLPILLLSACATSSNPQNPQRSGISGTSVPQNLQGPRGKYVPTPEMAVDFALDKDPRPWQMQFLNGDRSGIICEFFLKGDSTNAWKEMAAQQIVFTKNPLKQFVETWKSGLIKTDPKAQMKETVAGDGSIIIDYQSNAANEVGVRKFMQASDGIYMLAYHVRPASKNEKTYQSWMEIVDGSTLIPNPYKKR